MTRRVPFDTALLVAVLLLLGCGLVMVFSTSSVRFGDAQVFYRQLLFAVLGLLILLATMHLDYRLFTRPEVVYGLLALSLLALLGVFFFPEVKGAQRWVSVAGIRGQPSELAKLAMVLFTARFLVGCGSRLSTWRGLLPYTVVTAAVLGLILFEPDFGTAAVIAAICAVMLFLGGLSLRFFGGAAAVALPAFWALVLAVPYRRERWLAFLDPEESPLGVGYQIRQSLIAVGSGGVQGVGLAQSKQKLLFLPEAHTDYIFAIVGEELGLIGCGLLVAAFFFVFWRGVKISLRADTPLGTLLGLGIVAMVVLQALVNMSVVVSLLPPKGIPLPFFSVGGSSLLCNLAAIGILLNISRFSRAEGGRRWMKESDA